MGLPATSETSYSDGMVEWKGVRAADRRVGLANHTTEVVTFTAYAINTSRFKGFFITLPLPLLLWTPLSVTSGPIRYRSRSTYLGLSTRRGCATLF